MKKILAMILAMLLVLSMTAAFADVATEATATLYKVYTKNASTDSPTILPNDGVLEFEYEKLTDGAPDLTITAEEVSEDDAVNSKFEITVTADTSNTDIGVYEYTVTEKAKDNQGEVYSEETVGLKLYVFATEDPDLGATIPEGEEDKFDTFTNKYDVGGLKVTKQIEGNLADPEAEFNITITFEAEGTIGNTVTYKVAGGEAQKVTWNGKTAEVEVQLKGGDTVEFTNIPAGVAYTVEESAEHEEGNEDPASQNDPTKGYTIEYDDNVEGDIEADTTAETTIKNTKKAEIDTGIILQYAPYIAILAVVLAGAALLIIRRRRNNED